MWWGGGAGPVGLPKGQEQRMQNAACRLGSGRGAPRPQEERRLTPDPVFQPRKRTLGFRIPICAVIDMTQVCGTCLWERGLCGNPGLRCWKRTQHAVSVAWPPSLPVPCDLILAFCSPSVAGAPLLEEPRGQRGWLLWLYPVRCPVPRSSSAGAGTTPGLQHRKLALPGLCVAAGVPWLVLELAQASRSALPQVNYGHRPGGRPSWLGKGFCLFLKQRQNRGSQEMIGFSGTEGAWALKDSK